MQGPVDILVKASLPKAYRSKSTFTQRRDMFRAVLFLAVYDSDLNLGELDVKSSVLETSD